MESYLIIPHLYEKVNRSAPWTARASNKLRTESVKEIHGIWCEQWEVDMNDQGRITKAPPPIRPLGGWGGGISSPPPQDTERSIPFVPVSGSELIERWSVPWEAIFDFARQRILTPKEPEPRTLTHRLKDDFGMLAEIYTPAERSGYFARWLYHPDDCDRFEDEFPGILTDWQRKQARRKK